MAGVTQQGGNEAGAGRPRARTFPGRGRKKGHQGRLFTGEGDTGVGEKLGGGVQDRDLAYRECIHPGLIFTSREDRVGGDTPTPRF